MTVDWLSTFHEIGEQISEATLDLYGKPEGAEKLGIGAGGDMTLKLDKVAEDIIVKKLDEIGNVKLISEELGVKEFGDPEVVVVADPLDGSANARAGIPLFSTSLALTNLDAKLSSLQLGYVRNLITGDEFRAEKGGGAYFNNHQFRSSDSDKLEMLGVELYPFTETSISNTFRIMKVAVRTRILGSMALDLSFTAKGILDAAIDLRDCCRLVDLAAGKIILEEAGGIITDCKGQSIDEIEIDIGACTNIVAAGNKKVHQLILALIDNEG